MKLGDPFEIVPVNIYDVNTKSIVFTGSQFDGAKFLNCNIGSLRYYLSKKKRYKGMYAIRLAPKSQAA